MIKPTILFASAVLAVASSASAQYAGQGSTPAFTNLAEILRSAPDDARVELVGYIVKQVSREKYIFSDGKDQIRVEIEAEDWPGVRVDEKTKVRIRGEVEKDFMESTEIDVDHLAVL